MMYSLENLCILILDLISGVEYLKFNKVRNLKLRAALLTFWPLVIDCWRLIDWLSMVLRLRQHNIGYTADSFYRSDDTTNSVKALKEGTAEDN